MILSDLDVCKKGGFPPGYPADCRTFWAGRDDSHGVLMGVVGSVKHSIRISGYGYDDDDMHKLILGYMADPLVFVQISLDKSQAGGIHERQLVATFNQTYIGNSIAIGQSAAHAINHTKVIIVDGTFLITGSTNWSMSGEQKQNNELTVRDSAIAATEASTECDLIHAVMLAQMQPGIVAAANAAAANAT